MGREDASRCGRGWQEVESRVSHSPKPSSSAQDRQPAPKNTLEAVRRDLMGRQRDGVGCR